LKAQPLALDEPSKILPDLERSNSDKTKIEQIKEEIGENLHNMLTQTY
jgi:hypothetical protein